ncbi:hypothetical protein RirG_115720 [Rhizophagus irregularis DAOM 197198w]|uniref:Transposase domain-containing protein n=1 Tax=Rhizophagus irregularis (strain DAOM 197198w) TaxID=1432141 RepID=A0A015MKC9_RHIIW|nr:hypothetical protein RirG_115720 [Rhizophagus irregularis DAOM 197198w]
MADWFRMKDLQEHLHNAVAWKNQKMKEAWKDHDLLDSVDRKILANFVKACYLLVSQIIDEEKLNEAHNRLLKVARLIENNYGPEMVTPNIYLSLHLSECCRDYGPVYSFWCYFFERMNEILGSLPNSHRQIEPELLCIIMQNLRLNELISCHLHNPKLTEGLGLIKSRPTTGSLAAYDNFQHDELHRFMLIYNLEVEDIITGSEQFPGEMMAPRNNLVNLPNEIYKLLVDYYNNAYELEFVTIAGSMKSNNKPVVIWPQVNQFGRIQIGAEIFGSMNTPRYLKNLFILAKFVQENDSIEIYPGQVQYYFEHELKIGKEKKVIHKLVFVKWFIPAPNHQTRFHFQVDDIEAYNAEIWTNNFFEIDRDCIIPVHNILGRFIPSVYKIGKRNPVVYMAVLPIGRKFNM